MSKRRQEGTSEESSLMAKSRSMKSGIVTPGPMTCVEEIDENVDIDEPTHIIC